jgi:hypothetical protein
MRSWLWVDLWKLATSVTPSGYHVEDVFYYTAPLRKPDGSRDRQRTFIEANRTINPRLRVIDGYMEHRQRSCGTEHREEKQTDVNLAVDLVTHALGHRYAAAVLICGDSDQVAAVRMAQGAGLALFGRFPPARHSNHLEQVIQNESYEISKGRIKRSQMQEVVGSTSGYPLRRPAVEWGHRAGHDPVGA